MGLGKWAKKKAKQAKKKARQAGNAVKKTGEKAVKKGKQAVKGVERHVENAWDKTTDPMERLALKAEQAIREGISEMDVRKMIQDELGKLRGTLKREIVDEMGGKIEEGITQRLPDLMEKQLKGALAAISKASMKPVLKKAAASARSAHKHMQKLADSKPELVDAINNWERTIDLEANVTLCLSYTNFYDRALEVAGVLDRYANEGIKPRRRDIIGFFRAAGPTTVSYGLGAELSIGVQLGACYTETVQLELFLELADVILEEMGVPE